MIVVRNGRLSHDSIIRGRCPRSAGRAYRRPSSRYCQLGATWLLQSVRPNLPKPANRRAIMHSYIAVIFKDTWKPYRGMYALWQLDAAGDITVHGTTVVHLDACGDFQVDTMETQPAMATAVDVGI